MDEGNCMYSCPKDRISLGDVTNQLGKRGVSTFCGGIDGFVGIKEKNIGRSILVNEREGIKRARVLPRSCSEINSLKENAVLGILKGIGENREKGKNDFAQDDGKDDLASNRTDPIILDFSKKEMFHRSDAHVQDDDKLKEIIIPVVSSGEDDEGTSGEAGDEYCEILEHSGGPNKECGNGWRNADTDDEVVVSPEKDQSDTALLLDEGDHHGVDDLVRSQTGSVDHNRLPLSQESRCFGLERCTHLKGGDCSNTNATIEMMKSCTCSFCAKAAYIWTDLHYQDYKARIATIKNSEKEASLLVERSCRSMGTERHGNNAQTSTGVSNLDFELMGRWRSLFSQMEKIYEHESNHLEASLLSLKDLREKCSKWI